jgi:molybdate transport system substrate-binding protein
MPDLNEQNVLNVLSGGAAQAVVNTLRAQFTAQNNAGIQGEFGAVGVMKDKLLGGAPCDVIILTQALIEQLTASGHVLAGSAKALGIVKTGVAVKTGATQPDVRSPAALKAALLAASAIYFPDPIKATAGIHFFKILQTLGIDAELASKLRSFPNGATAMRAMAESNESGLIGCTQVTEILYTPGVKLIGNLPKEFELATVYTAAVCSTSLQRELAAKLVELLSSQVSLQIRGDAGFE